jgi:hypothetical protein
LGSQGFNFSLDNLLGKSGGSTGGEMGWAAAIPVATAAIGALGSWLGGSSEGTERRGFGPITRQTANKLGPALWGQFDQAKLRGFASDAARINFLMPEYTRPTRQGFGGLGSFGGGRNYSGLGKYEPYGSGAGTYGNTSKTQNWVPPWRKGSGDGRFDDDLGDYLTEDQAAHPGRQMQIGLRRGGGGSQGSMMRGTGAEQQGRMNEYRQVLRMRDSIASQGRLVRGAPKPGGGE